MSTPPVTTSTAIIVGCARSGSTSLFQMLTASPKIAHSKVKEPGFFIDCEQKGPAVLAAYETCFIERPEATLRLEATSTYFYHVPDVPQVINEIIPDSRVVIIFRDPYERLVSEFGYLKTRFLISPELSLEEYVRDCMAMPEADWRMHSNRHLLGVRNGYYDQYFPAWVDRFGDRMKVVFHEDLAADPQRLLLDLATWLDLPPIAVGGSLAVQNRSVPFRAAGLQRFALTINDRFELFFRRNPRLKAMLRSAYYRVNGASRENAEPLSPNHPLRSAYLASGLAFRAQLLEWNPSLALPKWLARL